jgi:RHS repeat-associated protein
MQGAGGVGGLLMVNAGSGGVHFPAYDLNGNVMGLVNATNGNISAKYEYGPFGEVFCSVGDMAKVNPFGFSTKYTDNETDLLCYGYRYYSPALGRWLSRDPIEERGGLNLYGFVNNDPVNKVDVIGRQTWIPYPGPGRCISDPINIEDPTIINTQLDAFKAWRFRKGKTYPVSWRIIEHIRDEDEYKEFLTSVSLKKAQELARCNKSDTYIVEDTSNSFQSHNFCCWKAMCSK